MAESVQEVIGWVENAISDMAYDQYQMWKREGCPMEIGYSDPAYEAFIKLKKSGCLDIAGAYADQEYNNPDTLQDLLGDRVCDACGYENKEARREFILELRKRNSFDAWKTACDNMLEDI